MGAQSLLKNETFLAAMDDIENHYCDLWKEAKNPNDREKVWLSLQNMRRVKVQLDAYYADYLADKNNMRLDEERERQKERMKKGL